MADITISDTTAWNKVQEENQYSLAKILGIWVAAALPMAILGWVAYPALAPDFESDPIGAAKTRVALLTVGLIWMFVLSLFIVYREEGNLRWATIRRRFWLNTPRDTKTGEPRRKLWLWLIPFALLFLASMVTIAPILGSWWLAVFPFFEPPAGFDPGELLSSPEIQAQLVGAWDFLLLFAVLAIFNTFGEEFLFRGVLLPKMGGIFGRWDWGGQWCVVFGLSLARTLGDIATHGRQHIHACPSGQALPQYLDVHYCPFYAIRGLHSHITRRAGLGVGAGGAGVADCAPSRVIY
jgi:membrane protease YdiL (CAAX protease family)